MSRSFLHLITAAAFVAACDSSPIQPSSSPTDMPPSSVLLGNVRVPFTATLTTCDGDIVDLSGVGHFHNTSTVTPNGDLHVTNHTTLLGAGTALSGASYLFNDSDNLVLNLGAVPVVFHEVESLTLLGQGGAQNLVGQALFHITVNAQGEVAVAIDELRIECPA